MLMHMDRDFDLVPQVPTVRKKLTNDDNDSDSDQYSDDKENDSELAGDSDEEDLDSEEVRKFCVNLLLFFLYKLHDISH